MKLINNNFIKEIKKRKEKGKGEEGEKGKENER